METKREEEELEEEEQRREKVKSFQRFVRSNSSTAEPHADDVRAPPHRRHPLHPKNIPASSAVSTKHARALQGQQPVYFIRKTFILKTHKGGFKFMLFVQTILTLTHILKVSVIKK